MRGFGPGSYGDAFADVYDDWYADLPDAAVAAECLHRLGGPGPVLELGIGTGRVALPLAARGIEVHGIDSSVAMLERLRAKPGSNAVHVVEGDMKADLPRGPFTLVYAAYNTFFNLLSHDDQQTCFSTVAGRLAPGGRFAVEAFVPAQPARTGSDVEVRDLAVDRVVLRISRYLADDQRAEGQHVELTERGVRLRPWAIRWATPDQLDAMARAAGFDREARWSGWDGSPFTTDSDHHVTVYRLALAKPDAGVS